MTEVHTITNDTKQSAYLVVFIVIIHCAEGTCLEEWLEIFKLGRGIWIYLAR
jgi:hypothetical protein